MGRRSSSISIGTIIFWAILASTFLFDDEDEKTISVESETEVVETNTKEELKNHITEAAKLAREELIKAKDKTIEIIDDYQEEEKLKEQEDSNIDQTYNNKEIKEKTIEKPKEEVVPNKTIKPLEENKPQPIEGMKKL